MPAYIYTDYNFSGCETRKKVDDGYCDDENNNAKCYYDGGDCCGLHINREYCDDCICYPNETCNVSLVQVNCGGHFAESCASCPQGNGAVWCNGDCNWVSGQCMDENYPIGDGYCDDATNTETCNFDGGDCCGPCSNKHSCSSCLCHEDQKIDPYCK